jgi:predicted RNA binding protein YcfA (HicA-like mRNA interferase family)
MPDSRDKPLRHRELISILKRFGVEEHKRKGSVRILFHPNIEGKPAYISIHAHNEHHEHSRKVIRAVRERFKIRIEEFY